MKHHAARDQQHARRPEHERFALAQPDELRHGRDEALRQAAPTVFAGRRFSVRMKVCSLRLGVPRVLARYSLS